MEPCGAPLESGAGSAIMTRMAFLKVVQLWGVTLGVALGAIAAGCDEDECFPDNVVEVQREASGTEVTLRAVVMSSDEAAIAVGDLGTILRRDAVEGAWDEQASGVDVDLFAVASPQPTSALVLAVGAGGAILRSVDDGETWKPRASGTTAPLYGAWMAEREGVAVAVGEGVAVRSDNAGLTWSPGQVPEDRRTLRAVAGREGELMAVGDGGLALRSVDEGATWERVVSGTTADLLAIAVDEHWFTLDLEGVRFMVAAADGSVRHVTDDGVWEALAGGDAPVVGLSREGSWTLLGDGLVRHSESGRPGQFPTESALLAVDGTLDAGFAVGEGGTIVRLKLLELGCLKSH